MPFARVAIAIALLFAPAAKAADDSWIREMPSVVQVERDIKGTNATDTAARQIGAFNILTEMASVRIGDLHAPQMLQNLSPPEQQLLRAYRDAKLDIYDKVQRTFDPNCRGANCPSETFGGLMAKYSVSKDLHDQVSNRYFDRQWIADYNAASAAVVTRNSQPVTNQLPADQGPSAADIVAVIGQLISGLLWYLVIGLGVFWWWRRRRKRAKIADEAKMEAKIYPERRAKEMSDAEMARLGPNAEARRQRIEELFNRRTESLEMDLDERNDFGQAALKGKLVRSIAAMSARERETLRAAYHLYNIGELVPRNFHAVRLVLLFGDGKAQVYKPEFIAGGTVQDFAAAVKNWTQMTAESAVSTVLQWLESVVKRRPDDPTVKLLSGRLLGGGDAALSDAAEFARAQNPQSKTALIFGSAEGNGTLVTYTGEGSVITVAPPGSGKTQCHVFPTLLNWRGPAVVLDVKGEIYSGTSKWRKENVGPVYKFSPLDPSTSSHYNPLAAVRSDPEYLWEDSRFLADMMMVPTETKDPFWENRARDILTAAIARACLTDDLAKRSLANLLDIFHGVGWDSFVRELQARVDIRSMVRAGASLGEMEKKTRDGVLQTGLSSLSAWDGDRIERTTRKSDWSPLDLRSGGNPTIYICLKPNEVESYISVLRVFIAQHIRMLTASLPPQGAAPILFVLDELPRLRQMPPVEEALEIGRQYGIKLWMFTQSLGQLENAYPNAEGMVGSCAVRMFMNPSLHDGTAQKLSDEIGFQEGVLDNSRQKIVEPPVLAGPEYKDFVLVMATGYKPFRLKKSYAYQDQTIRARMGSLTPAS